MSKVSAPFFSFGASGKIANALVAATWKGRSYLRRYVTPANPQTAAQTTHRANFAAAVWGWKNVLTDAAIRVGWTNVAALASPPISGFNAAQKAMVARITADPDASFGVSIAEASQVVTIGMKNIDDGAAGDEAGNFEVWTGSTPTGLTKLEDKAIAAGDVVTSDLGDTDDVVYIALRKDSQYRTGIMKVTLTA